LLDYLFHPRQASAVQVFHPLFEDFGERILIGFVHGWQSPLGVLGHFLWAAGGKMFQ
jgi:hypothetical protein